LKENIQSAQIHPDQTSVPVLDSSTSAIFAEKLASQDPNEIMYALDLFEIGQQVKAHGLVRNLLDHPSPHIRKRAIAVLGAAGDLTVKPRITTLIRDNSIDVRTEALL